MGIEVWVPRRDGVPGRETGPASAADEEAVAVDGPCADWETLERTIRSCRRCELAERRTQVVIGRGSRHADWFVIGEAPGAEEDRQGRPFVGPAGQLLDRMLASIGLGEDEVYIANTVKCRPPGNRDPRDEEVGACHDYLLAQIALTGPRLLLVVGRVAAQTLLATDAPLSRLRGRVHRHAETGLPLVVTYHPAYLLRSPREKERAWQDLCLARRTARETADGPA